MLTARAMKCVRIYFLIHLSRRLSPLPLEKSFIFHYAPRKGSHFSALPFMFTFLIPFCCFPVRTGRTFTLFFAHRVLELEGNSEKALSTFPVSQTAELRVVSWVVCGYQAGLGRTGTEAHVFRFPAFKLSDAQEDYFYLFVQVV